MELDIVEIILMTSLVNSIFFLILIHVTPKRYNRANLALTLFIFLSSLNFASWILIPYLATEFEWFNIDRFPVVYFLGPLLYAFSHAIFGTTDEKVLGIKNLAAGYLDVALTFILWAYIYFISPEEKFELLFDPLTLHIYEGIAIIWNAFYIYKSIHIFLNGTTNQPRFKHVFVVIVIIFFLWIGSFMADVAVYPSEMPDSSFYPLWILMVYLNFYLAYHFILSPVKSIKLLTSDTKPPSAKTLEVAEKLQDLMISEKLFRRSDLTLSFVAAELHISSAFLTNVLRDHFKVSYYDFINDHRVDDAMKRFENGDDKRYTIKTIAEESGFRSKTTFIKSFKNKTGMLPKDFISSSRQPKRSPKP
ncbi:MAG: helix-turn-helix transcriptional regulator [Cyclobacteriaceae bacterium]